MEIIAEKSSPSSEPLALGKPVVVSRTPPPAEAARRGRKAADKLEVRKRKGRSRITNGSALLPGIDGRSPWVRRVKDLIAAHISDCSGIENTSQAERDIIHHAAVLKAELEIREVKFATRGGASDAELDLYQRTAGNHRRLLESVGIQRRSKDITPPTTEAYFAHKQQQATNK